MVRVKVKIKPNGNGQECPFHTCNVKSNVNVKGERCRRPWFPPFAKNAKDGAPPSDEVRAKSKAKSKATDRSVRSTRAVFLPSLRDLVPLSLLTQGLRPGLHSVAALRLGFSGLFCALPPPF